MVEHKMTIPEQVEKQLMVHYQEGWQTLFAEGRDMQQKVLMDIIALGKGSDYARAHGFDQITTREEFEAKVPISGYEDYRIYIEDNMKNDRNQIIDLETEYYLMTTGTTGNVKYFAESRIGALARQLSIDIWNMALVRSVPEMQNPKMKMLAVVNCTSIDEAENGKRILRTSGQAGKILWERAGERYVFPYEFLEAEMSNDDRDYLTAVYMLKEENFSLLFCNNLAYFGTLLEWIAQCPQQMIDDIRLGQMTGELKAEDRAILRASFAADPIRAKQLQDLLDQQGYLPIDKIWPEFVFIGTWLSGSAGRLAKDVMRHLPERLQYISEGYGASEAMLTIPMTFGGLDGAIAPYAYYYEFLPLGGSKPVCMADVVEGHYYELIITTYSGLYRYNLHDIVCVKGFTGTTAHIEFCCKSTEICQLPNKCIYGFELTQLIERAEAQMGCLLCFYQGLVEDGRLSVVIQPYENDFAVEQYYGYLKAIMADNGIVLGKLYVMKKNYSAQLFRERMVDGKTMQNIKLLLVVTEKPNADWVERIYEG